MTINKVQRTAVSNEINSHVVNPFVPIVRGQRREYREQRDMSYELYSCRKDCLLLQAT